MKKGLIRKIYIEKRLTLSEEEYHLKNKQICKAFFDNVDLSSVNILHTYLPIEKNREPNTWLIINKIKKEYPRIKISLPRINPSIGNLESFFFERMNQLGLNSWGVLEPIAGVPTESTEIDMVLVPMLAFDRLGNRVGYGKGFYDKFLATCRNSCIKIGISFFEPIEKIEDTSIHDQQLSFAITPEGLTTFE